MSLLPVPRPETWEHIDLAEAHALALHDPATAEDRVIRLLQLVRLAGLHQRYDRAHQALADAEAIVATEDVTPATARSLASEQLWLAIGNGRTTDAVEGVMQRGLQLLQECGRDEVGTRARTLFCIGHCAAWLGTPDTLPQAADWLSESIGLLRLLQEPELQAEALLSLGYLVYPTQRLYHRAIAALQRSVALLPPGSSPRAVHLTYLGECRIITGDLAMADRDLAEAHAIGLRVGDKRTMGYAAWEMARIADIRRDTAGCDRWIAEARQRPGEWFGRAPGGEFLADTVLWAFRQGRADVARERCAELVSRGEKLTHGVDLGARGLVAFLDGDAAQAVALIDEYLALGWQETRLWHWQILLADILLAAGDTERAATLATETRHMVTVLGLVDVAQSLEPERWGRIMGGLTAATPQRTVRLLTSPAIADAAGVRPLPQGAPAAMFGLLGIAQRAIPLDEMCDALWPDVELAVARRRMRNLINRVRAIAPARDDAEPDFIQRTGDGLRLDPAAAVDCLQFEEAARAALRAAPASPQALTACLNQYGDGLLPGIAGERVEAHRRRFAQLALMVRHRLIESLIEMGDVAAAVTQAEIVLDEDPLDIELAVQVADAWAAVGEETPARAWRARAREIGDELGA